MKYKNDKRFFFLIFLFLSLSFLFIAPGNTATYYVDQNHPQASDSNPGTEELPWKTMIHGCEQLIAGDTLLVKNGTYATRRQPNDFMPGIRPLNSGTEDKPITIKAYPGHQPIIDGRTAEQNTFGGYQVSHIIIDGFKIIYGNIHFSECSYVTVKNCELVYGLNGFPGRDPDSSYTMMIEFRFTNFAVARNNKIHGMKENMPSGGDNRAAIMLHWANDVIIENNFFSGNHIAYRNKIGSQTSGDRNIFRFNYVEDCNIGVFMGGYDKVSADNKILQNVFVNMPISIYVNTGNIRLVIANNVFYNTPGFDVPGDAVSGITYFGQASTNQNNQIYNNIFENFESPISNHSYNAQWPPNLYIDYNLYNEFVGFDCYWKYISHDQFKAMVGNGNYVILNQDPKFVDPVNKNFRLKADSPCRNAGKTGVNMGAYIAGNEIIGLIRPSPPTNLVIVP